MLVIAFLVGILLKDVGIVLMVGNLDVVSIGTCQLAPKSIPHLDSFTRQSTA